jgi:hypothetical protein
MDRSDFFRAVTITSSIPNSAAAGICTGASVSAALALLAHKPASTIPGSETISRLDM